MYDKARVRELYAEVISHMKSVNIGCFKGMEKPLFLISDRYPGIWLEHVYDSVMYAKLENDGIELAKNTVDLFMEKQTEEGQLPCYILNPAKYHIPEMNIVGYSQIQEVVSFHKLCLEVYRLSGDEALLERSYESGKKWVGWLRNNRMTRNMGLVEMFFGYDTGHDESARLDGLKYPGNYINNGVAQNAATFPIGDEAAPIIAVDMNCNYHATLCALAEMAEILGKPDEANLFLNDAKTVKSLMFEHLYDKDDAFFYDVDKHGKKRKYLSCTVFHLFMEGFLDINEDAEIINAIYEKHINNPKEFKTEYPFPSMAACDPSVRTDVKANCWGYFSQALIALRCTMWMDKYGYKKDFDNLCEKWVQAWTEHYDITKFGQELDPHTGVPSPSSEWYSSCMLFYTYAVQRLGIV